MGWFLTKKKKRAQPRRRAGLDEAKPWDPKRTLAGLKVLGVFAVAIGLVIGWRYSQDYLLSYVQRHHQVPMTADSVVLVDAPAWMSEDIRAQVRQAAIKHIDPDPMDGQSLRNAAAALRENPWVQRVDQVARRYGGRVLVSADYRRPVAVVQSRDGYHLIDNQGVCLPGLYQENQAKRLGLVQLTGVSSAPPAQAGEVWPGEDVQAGLALIRLLADEPYLDNVLAFDVSHRDARGRLRLVLKTHDGTVRWGLPPGEEHSIEPDAQVKLGWLRQLARRDGSLSTGGQIIDIYGPAVPGVRQP
jgi:cell division septal protein FtsQ